MQKTVRIYGKRINEWFSTDEKGNKVLTQLEVEYKEYRENGELKCTGTEDFSPIRWNKRKQRWIWTWDGQKYNKGGNRRFDEQGMIQYAGDAGVLKKVLAKRYPLACEIEVRK
jgi:hypothetical protein